MKNDSKLKQPIPGNTPIKVANTKLTPYKYVGLLKLKFGTDDYYGTGTLIANQDAKKSQYVLTCAHNLYDPKDGEVSEVKFVRAYSDPTQPFTPIKAEKVFYPEDYPAVALSRDADLDTFGIKLLHVATELDYGLVKLEEAVDIDGFPSLAIKSDSQLKDLNAQINGYGYFGQEMGHATGKITVVESKYIQYPISTKKGASGSAIMMINDQEIVGIHTRAVTGKHLNQGVRVTKSVVDQIIAWLSE